MAELSFTPTRFVGLDVDKHTIMVCAITPQLKVVLTPRRIGLAQFPQWCLKNLTKADAVVLEATTNAWHLYDQLVEVVGSVTIANPLMVKLIGSAKVKTDARDALTLARLLAAGIIPSVWVPPKPVRELRLLISQRTRLVRQRTQLRNRLHSILHRHNIETPKEGAVFSNNQVSWWHKLDLSSVEKIKVKQDLSLLASLAPLVSELDEELVRLSREEPWQEQVAFLIQLPGISVINAMALLSAIGDIKRFETAKQLVGYSGLGASIHASGQTHKSGGITKQGRRELRMVLVEAAWRAVEHHAFWKAEFARLVPRLGRAKAIVAIARKLLVVVWHVLSKRVADQNVQAERVAMKFVIWGRRLKKARRGGLKNGEFVRQELERLGIGRELTEARWQCGSGVKLPPLKPEVSVSIAG
jgi:transposase